MVDIQSPTAEIRRGKKEEKKEKKEKKKDRNHRAKIYWPALFHRAAIRRRRKKIETTAAKYNGLPFFAAIITLRCEGSTALCSCVVDRLSYKSTTRNCTEFLASIHVDSLAGGQA